MLISPWSGLFPQLYGMSDLKAARVYPSAHLYLSVSLWIYLPVCLTLRPSRNIPTCLQSLWVYLTYFSSSSLSSRPVFLLAFLPMSLSSLIPFNTYRPSLLPIYTYFLFALLSSSPYIFPPLLTIRSTPNIPPTPAPVLFRPCPADSNPSYFCCLNCIHHSPACMSDTRQRPVHLLVSFVLVSHETQTQDRSCLSAFVNAWSFAAAPSSLPFIDSWTFPRREGETTIVDTT